MYEDEGLAEVVKIYCLLRRVVACEPLMNVVVGEYISESAPL